MSANGESTSHTSKQLLEIVHSTSLADDFDGVLAVLLVFLGLFPFANEIYLYVSEPLRALLPPGSSMIATEVASPFLTPFKLALVTAVFLAMPYLLHQFWAFIAPALYQHEKRLALPLLASSVLLFYLGAAFAYVVVFPLVFAFLTGVAPEGVLDLLSRCRHARIHQHLGQRLRKAVAAHGGGRQAVLPQLQELLHDHPPQDVHG